MTISDRSKDVIKSGGEWISSVHLETTVMGHDDVYEAAVIAVPDERWHERPLCVRRAYSRFAGERRRTS
jgi:fatty-acyl-CoA synthase